jgi:hypothetical protein
MSIILKMYIEDEVKKDCLQAISEYCQYKGEFMPALDELILSTVLTRKAITEIKKSIRGLKNISEDRKQNMETLIDIIDQINTTVGTLYTNLLKYLNTIKTGWWIFQTGRSELKNQFIAVMNQYPAEDWDRKMLEDLERQANAQQHAEPGNNDSEHVTSMARNIAYAQSNLARYEAEASRTQSPPPVSYSLFAGAQEELRTLFQSPPEGNRFSFFPKTEAETESSAYTASSINLGSINF